MATKPLVAPMGTATIGPSAWRSNTLKEIKSSKTVIEKSDKSCEVGRSKDPLPHLRDVVGELSNDEAHRYFRQTRAIVNMLRDSLIDTNEEIKSLTRGKVALEQALEHCRKDIKLNGDCQEIRTTRPTREKEKDGADDLLQAERLHLLNLKRMLESQLQMVQQQLQVLDSARRRLAATVQERSRVLDLICQALPSMSAGGMFSQRYGGTWNQNTYRQTQSADGRPGGYSDGGALAIDPLGPYTPEADLALQEAKDARSRSALLRKEISDAIGKTGRLQKAAHKSVNDGLTSKMSETASLKQHLDVASGENRHAIHRAQRWYDSSEKAWGYTRGPVSSSDMTTREKLHRPIIKVLQRHPGTNLPEAQEMVKGGDELLASLHNTSRNIGMLKLAQLKLKDDLRDKKAAMDIDGSILRMRRRKANHRWVMGGAF